MSGEASEEKAEMPVNDSIVSPEPSTDDFEVEGVGIDTDPQAEPEQPDSEPEEGNDQEEAEESADTEPEAEEASPENEDSLAEEPSAKSGKKSKKLQKRFADLTKQREEAHKRADTAEDRAAKAEAKADELEQRLANLEKQSADIPEPDADDFDNYKDYEKAMDEWEKKQHSADEAEPEKEAEPSQASDDAPEGFGAAVKSIERRIADWSEKPEDFDKVALSNAVPVTPGMIMALSDLEEPAQVLYKLGQDIELAKKIADMSSDINKFTAAQVRELTKLEMNLNKGRKPNSQKAKAETDVDVSDDEPDVPEPINPVDTGGEIVQKDISKMSEEEYIAYRNKQDQAPWYGG